MKFLKLLFIATILLTTNSYAQIDVKSITINEKEIFICNVIGSYPITGTYLFEGKTEPIIQLNTNGTGIFQPHDQEKMPMIWGIECYKTGIPIYKEGFGSAVYTIWYRTDVKNNDPETQEWIKGQFSIHYKKKKMFILGERSKDYED